MNKIFVSAAAMLLLSVNAIAQQPDDKDELQQKREQLRKEIAQTEKTLNETRKTAKVNIGQLSLINKKMDLQENVIGNISGEIKNLNDNIFVSQKEVNKMSRVLDTLKQEYANSMVYAYMNRSNYDYLNFIFSASSFNDAIKRVAYLKSYRSYREMQAETILKTQAMLSDKIKVLSGTKVKKNSVLQEQDKEMNQLQKQQEEKKLIVNKLNSQQKELTAQVNEKRKQDAKIRNMIAAMIKREIAARNEAARKERLTALKKNNADAKNANTNTNAKAAPAKASSILVYSEADKALNANFEKNKGVLPWPASGFIIEHFGRNELPGKVIYENPGVSIGVKTGETVKAVFDGEVTAVSYMEDKQIVFIKHGKYFTVYSNLASASVQRGDNVKTGQAIGKAAENDEGQGEVDLILMKENTNINPEQWLRR